jgi:shikimate dehydrogenase
MGGAEILTVSRRKSDVHVTYDEALSLHRDAQIIINTTPSGMYPDTESRPIDVSAFPRLEGVIDAVYNPLRTNLVLDALERGIKAEGGLFMLVMQAVAAVEKFLDTEIPNDTVDRVFASVLAGRENVVLTGMPGCGKSTVGKALKLCGFELIDTDEEIEKRCDCTIKELIAREGEAYFRDLESEVIRDVSRESRRIISTGGGAVLRGENVHCLKRNGRVFFIDAPLSRLRATGSRPLSDTEDKLKKLYNDRIDIYRSTADVTVPDMETPETEAEYILAKRTDLIL